MNNDPLYKEIILENWEHPMNYGTLKHSDVDVIEQNPLCGDEIRLMISFDNDQIAKIRFTAQGCAIAKASASLTTEAIKGMSKKDLENMKPEDVLEELGISLTPARTKCALLIYQTIKKITD